MVATDKPYKVIGTRPVRHDGADKVTGRATVRCRRTAADGCSTDASSAAPSPTRA